MRLFVVVVVAYSVFPGFSSAQRIDPLCTSGPDALTNLLGGYPVPQTCVDVPVVDDDGTVTTTVTERCFYTYMPASCAASGATIPLVVDIHGVYGCPTILPLYTGWIEQAENDCFAVMMPASSMDPGFTQSCWNLPGYAADPTFGTPDGNNVLTTPCCCATPEEEALGLTSDDPNPDDTAFIKIAIDTLLATFPATTPGVNLSLDPDRVYMAGHSNGCMTSLAMAAKHPEMVAAVCCHAGALITPFDSEGYAESPVPIWLVHGAKDTTIPYEGRSVETPQGVFGWWSVPDTGRYLRTVNGCTGESVRQLTNETTGEVLGSVRTGTGCVGDATVEILTLDESGHQPYPTIFFPESGGSATTVATTPMAWEFCSARSRTPVEPDEKLSKKDKKSKKKGEKKKKDEKKADKKKADKKGDQNTEG